ncbi:hypothetical protein [Deinococcus knuensis]|uniref:hypothetical protein n=1 Tax=Deinococcus knuensis TaxID=1837380 RepID=UPI00166DAEAD|nr:hypothetical protein [Deinococcus knuensis]
MLSLTLQGGALLRAGALVFPEQMGGAQGGLRNPALQLNRSTEERLEITLAAGGGLFRERLRRVRLLVGVGAGPAGRFARELHGVLLVSSC